MRNFGADFKKARESKGISLDRVSAETRISTRFLVAIENEEFNLLPGGIFNRGFVRAYAEKIGLDPDQTVAEYERLVAVREPLAPPTPKTPSNGKGDRRLYPLAIGGLLVIIVFYIFTKETSNTAETASPPSATSAAASPQPTPAPSTPPPSEPVSPPTAPPEVTSAAPEPETPPQTEPVRIDINVTETTWIKVGADGVTVDAGEILEPGTTRHFAAQNSIYLSIGNAGGLSLKINDMTAKSLGKSGQVRELTITPQNMKSFIS